MYYLHWVLIALLLSNSGSLFISVDQTATCTMDDKTHKATYNCPDGYEVIYTGEGEKECNGKCYRKGNSESLRNAISQLLIDSKMTGIEPAQLADAITTLHNEDKVTISTRRRQITLYAPKNDH